MKRAPFALPPDWLGPWRAQLYLRHHQPCGDGSQTRPGRAQLGSGFKLPLPRTRGLSGSESRTHTVRLEPPGIQLAFWSVPDKSVSDKRTGMKAET
jgi:hypothetical protein